MNSSWQKPTFCETFLDTWALWIWKWRSGTIVNSVARLCDFNYYYYFHITPHGKKKLEHLWHTSHPSWQTLTKLTASPSDSKASAFPLRDRRLLINRSPSNPRQPPVWEQKRQRLVFICFKTPLAVWVVIFQSNHVSQHQYPAIRKVALLILTVFGSTCLWEVSFSHAIKTRALYFSISIMLVLTHCEPNYV